AAGRERLGEIPLTVGAAPELDDFAREEPLWRGGGGGPGLRGGGGARGGAGGGGAGGARARGSWLELPFARIPTPEVAFACGSRSITSARSPASARQAARVTAVGVLPPPPFWVASEVGRGHV